MPYSSLRKEDPAIGPARSKCSLKAGRHELIHLITKIFIE